MSQISRQVFEDYMDESNEDFKELMSSIDSSELVSQDRNICRHCHTPSFVKGVWQGTLPCEKRAAGHQFVMNPKWSRKEETYDY